MKTLRRSLYTFLIAGVCIVGSLALLPGQAWADDSRDAAVDQDMQRMKTAMTTGDFTTLIDLMYQPIVQVAGGKEAMLAQAKAMTGKVSFTSFEAAKPYVYYTGTDNDYVVVTTHVVMVANGHHFDSASFQLGIKSHKDGGWQYVDGAGVKPQAREHFFPDLPKDAVLPEVQHKQLD